MSHPFEINQEIELDATPEQVWEAIATGPGIDAWFFGHSTIEPRLGGRTTFEMGGEVAGSTITAWEPGKRFAYRTDEGPDGSFMAFESIIEGRAGGSTVLRYVHSGMLGGDDWEAEYDALREGDPMYLRKLAAYLATFKGATVRQSIMLFQPGVTDSGHAWSAFTEGLGVTGPLTVGTPVKLAADGRDGVVAFVDEPHWVGVTTADGMVSLMHARGSVVVAEYQGYSDERDQQEIESRLQSWLDSAFA
jgi:uncharacterized protein YndB with AHSA1/START domain